MCLLALFYRVVDDAPVVAGANREELYARGGEPPPDRCLSISPAARASLGGRGAGASSLPRPSCPFLGFSVLSQRPCTPHGF